VREEKINKKKTTQNNKKLFFLSKMRITRWVDDRIDNKLD
jgi:hypothetical protein